MGTNQFWMEKCKMMNPEKNQSKKTNTKTNAQNPNQSKKTSTCKILFVTCFESSSFLLSFLSLSLSPILSHSGEFSHSCHARYVLHCSQTSPSLHAQSLVSYFLSILHNFSYIFFCLSLFLLWTLLYKNTRPWEQGQFFAFCKALWKAVDHININNTC